MDATRDDGMQIALLKTMLLSPLPASRAPRARLLMIESGAPLLIAGADEFDHTVAITQVAGERPADFAARTLSRIASAQRFGNFFAAAELFVGTRHDAPTCAARRLVGLAIAEHAGRSQVLSELVAVVSADAAPEVREQLRELGEELAFSGENKSLRLRLRYIEEHP